MLDAHVNGIANVYSKLADSKARFEAATGYIVENVTFPIPLVVMQLRDGLSVIDGNHRATALCYCQATTDEILEAGGLAPLTNHLVWIGTHQSGEVPFD
jgi:hypothetical protein